MKVKLFIIFLFVWVLEQNIAVAKTMHDSDYVKILIQSNIGSNYKSTMTIHSNFFQKKINSKKYMTVLNYTPVTDAYLFQATNGKIKKYLIDEDLNLFDMESKKVYKQPDGVKHKLDKYLAILRHKHYGALLPWTKVNKIIPKYSKFQIIDLDTGAKFSVQRRAGSNHADVQPLSRKDTKIMKKIYRGNWSWKRRAILIDTGDKLIAASMHGMPHGKGALINGFPGHFCVHFHLSKTHKRNIPDFAHNLMTLKAAGKTKEYFNTVTPENVVDSFILAIHQQDMQLLKLTTTTRQYSQAEKLYRRLESVRTMKRMSFYSDTEIDSTSLFLAIPVEIQIITDNHFEKKWVNFFIYRDVPSNSWKVDINAIGNQL